MTKNPTAEQFEKQRQRRETRKRSSDDIRAARERLSGTSQITPEFEYELLACSPATKWVRRSPCRPCRDFCARGHVLGAVIEAVAWLGLVIAAKVVLIENCRRFLAQPRDQINLESWRRRLIFPSF